MPSKCSTCQDGKRISGTAETCDEGLPDLTGTGAGCKANCIGAETGWICTGGSEFTKDICSPECGDGLLLGSETCDDGSDDGIGCDSSCVTNLLGYDCSTTWFNGTTKCLAIC